MGAVARFFESRLGVGDLVRRVATEKHPPLRTSWLHTIGYAALSVLILQAITGIALAFFYVPAADHAHDSIRYMERDVPGGALLRALHHWGASAIVVLVFLHGIRVFFHGAYKRPREFTWLFGLGLFGVTVGFAFTGYLLPWDQAAYFATKVGVNIAAQVPVVGEHVKSVLYGADEIGSQTLTRFFALHVLVLPALLVLFGVLHLYQIQRHGIAPVGVNVHESAVSGRAYHPYHTLKEAIVSIAVVGIVFALASVVGVGLEAEAEPADTSYDPRPDWYFFAPFQLLKLFEGSNELVGTFWLPAGIGALLVLLPFIDRNPERSLRRRPLCLLLGTLFIVAVVTLTVWGATDEPTHFRVPAHPLGASSEIRRGYNLVRQEDCWSCHTLNLGGVVYGQERPDLDAPGMEDFDYEPEDLAEFLRDTGSDEMPSFPHLSQAERLAIGRYLRQVAK